MVSKMASYVDIERLGQFFTPKHIIETAKSLLLSHQVIAKTGLEPSVGSGNLLPLFADVFKSSDVEGNIDAFEIDNNLRPQFPGMVLKHTDYLLDESDKKYDLIISNPPYSKLRNFGKTYHNKYGSFIFGHSDIYLLFIAKIISQLEEDGFGLLIIPTAFKVNVSASKVRKYLLDNCEIIDLVDCGNFGKAECGSSKLPREVKQDVMVLLIKKRALAIDTPLENNIIHSTPVSPITGVSSSTSTEDKMTIAKLGCIVKNGNICWNEHKEKLTDDFSATFLLYSFNIANNEMMLKTTAVEKKQYINLTKVPAPRTFIAIPRIANSEAVRARLYVNASVAVENHVITIEHSDANVLKRLIEKAPFKRTNSGSVMLTVGEVKNLIVE